MLLDPEENELPEMDEAGTNCWDGVKDEDDPEELENPEEEEL